ncbi:hypothetical protein OAJ36_01330 [Nitrosopumilus sp.]|nr:hypothetical protein [Nitrosopumilus sp.]
MNNKYLISISIIITIVIIAFSITQIGIINEKKTSYVDQSVQINSMLKKIQEDKTKNENSEKPYIPKEREWHGSGGFSIDRSEYVLGEKIFVNVKNIDENMKGDMLFSKIINSTQNKLYKKISFDGSKSQSNFYLPIYPSIPSGFCTVDSLIGEWEIVFNEIDMQSIKFKISSQMIPGVENYFKPVC